MDVIASMRNYALPPGYKLGLGVTAGDNALFGAPLAPSTPAGAETSSSTTGQKAPLSRLADQLLSDLLSLQGIG